MAIAELILDPDAQSYTDDEIVGKVNAATDKITRVDGVEIAAINESATELLLSDTERAKLSGIAAGAEVNDADLAELDPTQNTKLNGIEEGADVNPTGIEIDGLVVAVAPADRKIVISDPAAGEFRVAAVQRRTDGKLGVDYEDVAES